MNPYFMLGGFVAFLVSVGGAYYQGRVDGGDKCIAEQARDERVTIIASEAAASAAADAISKIKVKHTTVRQELEREIVNHEVFRECHSGPDAVRMFNAAIPGYAAASAADSGVVPTSDASGR